MTFETSWLSDPEIFSVNRLPAVSDHQIYRTAPEADADMSSLVRSLDGIWKAHFAACPVEAPDALLTCGDGDAALAEITVPGEFQLQNPDWDCPQYANVQYPWDGKYALVPPQVSDIHNPTWTAAGWCSPSTAWRLPWPCMSTASSLVTARIASPPITLM